MQITPNPRPQKTEAAPAQPLTTPKPALVEKNTPARSTAKSTPAQQYVDRKATATQTQGATRSQDDALAALVQSRAKKFAAAAPAPTPDAAAGTAAQMRHSSDADKLKLFDSLEAMGNAGHAGWQAVYDNPSVVQNLAGIVKETYDPKVEKRAADFLFKVYRDHAQDDGPASSSLKSTATQGLVDTFGSDILRVATRSGNDPALAEAIFNRAQWGLDNPYIRAGKGTPLLEEMGISGAGQGVMVVDAAGSDHMAHTSYLANPERSGSKLLTYGCTETSGPESIRQFREALDLAKKQGAKVLSCSMGVGWEGRDKEMYIAAAGGDEAKGHAAYEKDIQSLAKAIDKFPGIVVVAAGNSGPNSITNDFARSSKVIVANAMEWDETRASDFNSPANHPEMRLGVGTAVWAPAADGGMRSLDRATSWAAPQIAHFAACVFEAGGMYGQKISAAEVRESLQKTAEPLAGGVPRADVITAARYAKSLAFVKSTKDAALLRQYRALSPAQAREAANQIEPMLYQTGPDTKARIAQILGSLPA